MRIGIITLEGGMNYGNRLQNYAMYKLLEGYGAEPVNIAFHIKKEFVEISESPVKRFIKSFMPVWFLHWNQRRREGKEERARNFWKFTEDTMGKTLHFFANRYEDIAGKIKVGEFSCFVAGSDQIWNPEFAGSECYFLTFAPPEKRIAFAASIGQSELPEEVMARYQPMLKEMKYISVREERAALLVKEMIGHEVDVIPDPTLLVKRKRWENLVRKPEVSLPGQYILVFFLGELPHQAIEKFAGRRGLPVVYLNHREYQKLFALAPPEFLYLLMHASYVLTDSFHGTVFSILFERQFFVFRRKEQGVKDMFSRLETLLQNFGLDEREQPWDEVREIPPVSEKDWGRIRRKLKQERERADKILSSLLWKERR